MCQFCPTEIAGLQEDDLSGDRGKRWISRKPLKSNKLHGAKMTSDVFEGDFIRGSNTHNCVPGRILKFEGPDGYAAYVERQKAAGVRYGDIDMMIEEILAEIGPGDRPSLIRSARNREPGIRGLGCINSGRI
jgi:hypothetical protein